ncbi:MAG: hypothetical protein LQ350_000022 [Teloschistes chrysophthalmus]|nr:MAG: hypothetical protein LQ350_000022 [Niorma chrysophthalma]
MAPTDAVPSEIAGYRVLPISLPPLPSYPVPATHYLYLHPHEPKFPTPTAARALFLVNVPIDSTELHLKSLLSVQIGLPQGRIEEVQFEGSKKKTEGAEAHAAQSDKGQRKGRKRKRALNDGDISELEGTSLPATWDRELRTDGLTAVIVFVDRASMDAAYKAVKRISKTNDWPVWGEGLEGKVPALGAARYLNHHRLQYPDKQELLESVNAYMTEYSAREAAQARARARQRQVPDEDGFITVTKGGRVDPARQEAAQQLVEKQKAKQKGLEDFYRFQTREKKKAKAAELMKKFEKDKEMVKRMKERRNTFKVGCPP